jgi:hypothetical protein
MNLITKLKNYILKNNVTKGLTSIFIIACVGAIITQIFDCSNSVMFGIIVLMSVGNIASYFMIFSDIDNKETNKKS